MLSAVGAGNLLFINIVGHLLICPACNACAVKVLDKIVGAVTGFALLAVHQRIGKSAQMSRGDPGLGVHKNCGVKTNVVLVLLHKLFKPSLLDVVFKRHTERTVIPGIGESAVNLRAGIYKASALAERNDFFHCLFGVLHKRTSFLCLNSIQ